jgi:uncharacterized lipoprotein YddW (UPF0748 family)/N-acetylmuramoyl-L-alanine amidase
MKKFFAIAFALFLSLMYTVPPTVPVYASSQSATQFRAFWVSSAYNMDFPTKSSLTTAQMREEIDKLINRAVQLNFNAVIVQVRPSGDALYDSKIYPWSAMLTGTQGQPPAGGFDPFAYWVERAHANNLEIHAWINPYRVTYPSETKPDLNQLAANNPARVNPSWVMEYESSDGRIGHYLDPGRPECRELVLAGVAEIINGYMVDGIHLDDYFYPGTDFPDDSSYNLYGVGQTRDDWRRENVNTLIRQIRQVVKDKDPGIRFGISPTAIWLNKSSSELGSDTRGYESYKSAYADTRLWVKEGWLDYICPQIYWYIGYEIADYAKVLAWWEDVCRGSTVDLYIGHAAYQQEAKTTGWTAGEISRQLSLNAVGGIVKGDIFFRAGSLFGEVGEEIRKYYATAPVGTITPTPAPSFTVNVGPAVVMNKLSVASPSGDKNVKSGEGFQIYGTCVPGVALFMNGNAVINRTPEGFFSIYVPLAKGGNVFTFTQEGQEPVTRIITLKEDDETPPAVMDVIALSDAYPKADEMGSTGDVITLRCTAPAEAIVTARINGETVSLFQTNANLRNDSKIYAASYRGTYNLPDTANSSVITELGKPVYTMLFNGETYTVTASASVKLIGGSVPFYAEIAEDLVWAYPNATESGGSSWDLVRGQRDRITAVSVNGAWVRLACGGWVQAANITTFTENEFNPNPLSEGQYVQGSNEDIVSWRSDSNAATTADYDGKTLTLRFGIQKSPPNHGFIANNTMFENILTGWDRGAPCYVFTLRPDAKLEGFYTDYVNGELRFHIRKRKSLTIGSQPLMGFNIVLDAGHGFNQPGAIGPMGMDMPEKDINLTNSLKIAARLKQMGANVIPVRDTDIFVDLHPRTKFNRDNMPDLFLSVHGNAVAESTDSTDIHGLTMWYRNAVSKPLADTFIQTLHTINPLTNRSVESNQSNLYVVRPAWTPSVIMETSFICNVEDFAWMVNPARQDELAWAVVNAVLAYYR